MSDETQLSRGAFFYLPLLPHNSITDLATKRQSLGSTDAETCPLGLCLINQIDLEAGVFAFTGRKDEMMAVSKKDRFEVFKRDNFTCQYCGRSAPDVILHADHIDPMAKGGKDDILNLITSCFDCNAGKSDRTLSDDTVIKKRKQQLDQLQQRREQLEMMLEWQRGLLDLEEETITKIADFWAELIIGYHLNEVGLENLKRYVKRFGIEEIIEAMKIATKQYLKWDDGKDSTIPTQDSVNIAWSYISKICVTRQREKSRPYLKDLYYIRGILRNRVGLSGKREGLSIALMDKAVKAGIDIEDMKQLSKEIRYWHQFNDTVNIWIAEAMEEAKPNTTI